MSSKPLVIIDVQDTFIDEMGERRSGYVKNVVRAVLRAKEGRRPIVAVNYRDCGPLSSEVREALRGYHRWKLCWKYTDDGSVSVDKALYRMGVYKPAILSVCGVNAYYCVADTVRGLAGQGYRLHILSSAVRDTNYPRMVPTKKYADTFPRGKVVVL